MKTYTKGIETKRSIVLWTYQKLKEENVSSLTVRRIAGELGYSPSILYRYFESIDELISVSSVHFLYQYMKEYAKLIDSDNDLLEMYLEGWKLFNQYAFDRPDIYYSLFWGRYNNTFSDAIMTHYELFPFSDSEKFPEYCYTMFFTDSITERDYQILHRCVNEGKIEERAAKFLSRSNPLLVKGILEESLNQPSGEREKMRKECDKLLENNLEYCVK